MRQSKETIERLPVKASRYWVPFEHGSPLWIRVEASGAKSFYYRGGGGKNSKQLGRICGAGGKPVPDAMSLTTARRLADEHRGANADGAFLPEALRQYFEKRAADAAQADEPLRSLFLTSTQLGWLCEAVQGLPAPVTEEDAGITVETAWHLYMEREGGKRQARTKASKERVWRTHLQPAWGTRPIRSITDDDCVALLEQKLSEATARGEIGTGVNEIHKALTRFFNWCVSQGRGATGLKQSPIFGIGKVVDEALSRRPPRPLSPAELRWFFLALDEFSRTSPSKFGLAENNGKAPRAAQATEFALRSVCRRSNIFEAHWTHVEAEGLFLPRTKNSTPFMVPLHPSMRALIGTREGTDERLWGMDMRLLSRCLEEVRKIMNRIARRDGFNGDFVAEFLDEKTKERNPHYFTLHNFRDTATTLLSRPPHRVGKEVRQALLNHRPSTVESKHYNGDSQDAFWMIEERTAAGKLWNDYLDAVKAGALEPNAEAA